MTGTVAGDTPAECEQCRTAEQLAVDVLQVRQLERIGEHRAAAAQHKAEQQRGGGDGAAEHEHQRRVEIAEYVRSEEHTSELQSLMRISYAVFCLKKKTHTPTNNQQSESTQRQKHTTRETD